MALWASQYKLEEESNRDALSCAIFIICIDPLLRNLNANNEIKFVKNLSKTLFKAAVYADDISVICKKDSRSIQLVFNEYENLTKRSGLELNADKTEILVLNKTENRPFIVDYNNTWFVIEPVMEIKICGLVYSLDEKREYSRNVLGKIKKLGKQSKTMVS